MAGQRQLLAIRIIAVIAILFLIGGVTATDFGMSVLEEEGPEEATATLFNNMLSPLNSGLASAFQLISSIAELASSFAHPGAAASGGGPSAGPAEGGSGSAAGSAGGAGGGNPAPGFVGQGAAVEAALAANSGGNGYPPPPIPTTQATQTPVTAVPTNAPVVSGTEVPGSNPGSTSQSDSDFGGGAGATANTATPAIPVITSVSPSGGPLVGGTSVSIRGNEFNWVSGVRFGSTAAASYTVDSVGLITAVSPAGSAGTVDITVVNNGGTSATSAADQFTYYAVPVVSSISPAEGPAAGGSTVTITGTGLSGATAVKFGSNTSTITSVTATEIKVTTPAGDPGILDITVTTPGGTSATGAGDQYTYRATPVITGIAPSGGPLVGGTSVVITGTGLDCGTATVKFGTVNATSATVDSDTQITAVSPAGSAGTVDITVANTGGTSATSAADRFTYYVVPTVTGIAPLSGTGIGGTSVTITGTGFTGATGVSFGVTTIPAAGFTVVSDTSITISSPSGVGLVDVTVTTPGGTSATSAADQFTYT